MRWRKVGLKGEVTEKGWDVAVSNLFFFKDKRDLLENPFKNKFDFHEKENLVKKLVKKDNYKRYKIEIIKEEMKT